MTSTPVDLRLRDTIDVDAHAATYAKDGVVQVHDLFTPEAADALATMMATSIQWRLVYADEHTGPTILTQAQIKQMGTQGQGALIQKINALARKNIGFFYGIYPMIQAYVERWDPGHPIHTLTEFLNSPPFRELGAKIIGCPSVNKVDVQATSYGPGQFLTRHIDVGDKDERRCALTIGLSKQWEPDWGGLLMFLDKDMNIERGLLPRFNTLTLFRHTKVHTVSAVAPFAGAPRYSLAGWLRDDPVPSPR